MDGWNLMETAENKKETLETIVRTQKKKLNFSLIAFFPPKAMFICLN